MKIMRYFGLCAAFALVACNNETEVPLTDSVTGIAFEVEEWVSEPDSRMAVTIDGSGAHFAWQNTDTVGVFPNQGNQTAFPMSAGEGASSAKFDGADWGLRSSARYAAYFPFARTNYFCSKNQLPVSYTGQKQTRDGDFSHLGAYDFLACKFSDVDAEGNVLFSMKHLGCLVRFRFTMPIVDRYSFMNITTSAGQFMEKATFDLSSETPQLTMVSGSDTFTLSFFTLYTSAAGQEIVLAAMLPPGDFSSATWTISLKGNARVYSTEVQGKNLQAGNIYDVPVTF